MFGLPVEPVQPLHGAGREQELARPRAVLDAFDGDAGVGDGPLGDAALGDLSIPRDLVIRRQLDAVEDLLQKQAALDSHIP